MKRKGKKVLKELEVEEGEEEIERGGGGVALFQRYYKLSDCYCHDCYSYTMSLSSDDWLELSRHRKLYDPTYGLRKGTT